MLFVVAAVLGLGAIGLTTAYADSSGYSTWCTDGAGGSTDVPNPVVGLSYEPSPSALWVCYSTTPTGSGSPEAAGGNLVVWNPAAHPAGGVECRGDRGTNQTASVDCAALVIPTDPSSAPGTTASAFVQVGTVGPVTLGQTGAEVESPVPSPNGPGGGDGTGGIVNEPGNCLYVNGTPDCVPGRPVAVVTVAEGDLPVVETRPDCVNVNGTCQVPIVGGARVTVNGDTANETVYVDTIAGVGMSQDGLPTCVGVAYNCP